jgi:hypothetical protein
MNDVSGSGGSTSTEKYSNISSNVRRNRMLLFPTHQEEHDHHVSPPAETKDAAASSGNMTYFSHVSPQTPRATAA